MSWERDRHDATEIFPMDRGGGSEGAGAQRPTTGRSSTSGVSSPLLKNSSKRSRVSSAATSGKDDGDRDESGPGDVDMTPPASGVRGGAASGNGNGNARVGVKSEDLKGSEANGKGGS